LSGLSCDEYGDTEALIFVTAVAASMEEIQEENIGDTTCLDVAEDRRRMQLLRASDSVIITFIVTVHHSVENTSYALSLLFNDAIESGVLDDAIEMMAIENGVSVMSSVHATSVTVRNVDSANLPTLMPTTIYLSDRENTQSVNAALLSGAFGGLFVAVAMVIMVYVTVRKYKMKSSQSKDGASIYRDSEMLEGPFVPNPKIHSEAESPEWHFSGWSLAM